MYSEGYVEPYSRLVCFIFHFKLGGGYYLVLAEI